MVDNIRCQQMVLELEAASSDSRRSLHILNKAQGAGFVTAAMGILAALGVIFYWGPQNPASPLAATLCLFSGCGLIAFPIGVISGWLAHRWFYTTRYSVVGMAIALALIGDLTLAGWTLVFLYQ